MTKKQKNMLWRIIASIIMLVALGFTPESAFDSAGALISVAGRWVRFACYLAPYLTIGHDILRKALHGIVNRQLFDENFLMAIATVGAMAIAVYENGDYLEGVAVMLFYQIGELFQAVAVGRSRRNISALMDIRPDHADIERDGEIVRVDPDEVPIGSVIVVSPGEKIPIDGTIIEGSSALDTSALTGESVPRPVEAGMEVSSGCVSMTGLLRIRTARAFGESTVSKILDLVENASSRKSQPEKLISKFAYVYTPAVCISALALALVPPIVRLAFMGTDPMWGDWVYRALTFLVISCPCALVISVPLTFFAGIGGASSEGVLVKGSNYLEELSKAGIIVFDKTGTLTRGVFEVTEVCAIGCDRDRLIEIAALAECASNHPIAASLRRAYGAEPDRSRVSDIHEESGLGVTALVDGVRTSVGSVRLVARDGALVPDEEPHGTTIHVSTGGVYLGSITASDQPKEGAKDAISALYDIGVSRIVILTGDAESAAAAVAGALGVKEWASGLMPADKVARAEELIQQRPAGKRLAFVGDGINDAPVLSRADIGIAMGAMGSDAAIEAADVVLMDDDPRKIAKAVKIARKCLSIVHQNIVFAIGVKFVCLALGALGIANMWLAVFADVGVMVLAVLNAVRALFVKHL